MKKLMVLGVLLLLAGCKQNAGTGAGMTVGDAGGGNSGGGGITGTLAEMMARGVGMNCTYEIDGAQFQSKIKGNNYSGKIAKDGKVMNSIMANGYMYMWEEGKTAGIKMEFDPTSMTENPDSNGATETETMPAQYGNPNVKYNCSPGVVTDSAFAPPAGINFVDPFEMMGGDLTQEQMDALQQMGAEDE